MTMPSTRNGSTWTTADQSMQENEYSNGNTPASLAYSSEAEPQHDINSWDDSNESRQRRETSVQTRRSTRRGSRRASLGGTTIYKTPDMAKMDAFLRSSGLRLKRDGTCQFLFERTRFIIETSTDMEETGEFLLYCSLGKLRYLRENFGSQRKLLKSLVLWNTELQNKGGDDTGLLRIDSSKEDGPHVSFIYYGQMKNMESQENFLELLDEFVDDALYFLHRLNNGDVEEEDVPVRKNSPGRDKRATYNHTTGSALALDDSTRGYSLNRTSQLSQPGATSYQPEFGSSSISLNTSQDKNKKSVLSKVMSSLQKKNDPTVAMAFIDPSNPTSAFVVDKTVVSSNNIDAIAKSKNGCSRKAANNRGTSFHEGGPNHTNPQQTKHTKSFHDERSGEVNKLSYSSDDQNDGRRGSTVSKKSSQLSNGEENYAMNFDKKSTSFNDSKKTSISDESSRKIKSFHHLGRSKQLSIDPKESSDRIEKNTSHNVGFNQSVNLFNDSGSCESKNKFIVGEFNSSEPVVMSSRVKSQVVARLRQAKIQPDTHQDKQQYDNYAHNQVSGHRRKTRTEVKRLNPYEQRREAYPFEDSALKAYYEKHSAYPPNPSLRHGSKWCMKNRQNDSDYESDESS